MQDNKPVAYTSSKFIPAEHNYTTGEQELLGVFKALKEWRCYLEGSKTTYNPNHHYLAVRLNGWNLWPVLNMTGYTALAD